jgi:hypothetical protein
MAKQGRNGDGARTLASSEDLQYELRQLIQSSSESLCVAIDEWFANAANRIPMRPCVQASNGDAMNSPAMRKESKTKDCTHSFKLRDGWFADGNLEACDEWSNSRQEASQVSDQPFKYTLINTDEPEECSPEKDQGHDRKALLRMDASGTMVYDDMVSKNTVLDVITLTMLVANSIVDGIEVDYQARTGETTGRPWMRAFELTLCLGFVVELGVRVNRWGLKGFLSRSSPRKWLWLQAVLAMAQVTQEFFNVRESWFDLAFPGSLRDRQRLRLVTTFRIFRLLHVFDCLDMAHEFHLLLTSISGALNSVFWSVLFVMIPMFVFALMLTQGVAEYKHRDDAQDSIDELNDFFGSLDRSMLCLFWSISGGLSWSIAMRPLMNHQLILLAQGFIVYIAATVFTVLNILTGVFVNSATCAADNESEKKTVKALRNFFPRSRY